MRGTMQFSKYDYTIKNRTQTQSEYILYAKANKRLHFPFTFYEHSAPLITTNKIYTTMKSKLHTSSERETQKLKQCTFKFFYVNMSEQSGFFLILKSILELITEPLEDANTFSVFKDETHRVSDQHCAIFALIKPPPLQQLQTFYLLKRYKQST